MDNEKSDSGLFPEEEKVISMAKEILDQSSVTPENLREGFEQLLNEYVKLNSHLSKLIRISDKQQLQLNKLNDELNKRYDEKMNFFLNMVHETKTPLTLIVNYLDKYIRQHGTNQELSVIKQNIDKLQRDMVNFLDVEKLEKGNTFYNHDLIINLSEILKNKVLLFKESAKKKEIRLTSQIQDNIYVKIDPYAMDRIINNLISNAIRYNVVGGTIEVMLKKMKEDEVVDFSVQDSGIGMSQDQKNKIFELFYQISHEKRNLQGIGMGLNLVKKIVDSVEGNLIVESEISKGSIFHVLLNPYQLQDSDQVESDFELTPPKQELHIVRLQKEEVKKNRKNILLVEDNVELLAYLQTSLYDDYNVFVASNGREGLNKIRKIKKPHIIISDIMMDEMNGYDFYEAIMKEEDFKNIPFIFLTAKTGIEEKIKGLSYGAIDFINKPFVIDELIAKIDSILKNQDAQLKHNMDKVQKAILNVMSEDRSEEEERERFESRCEDYGLTEREKEVLFLVLKGKENKEISNELNISQNTVKTHIQNIYLKSNVQNKIELVNFWK